MKAVTTIFAITLFLNQQVYAYNPFWILQDRKLIKAVVNLDKNDPYQVEHYFKTQRIQKADTTKENLGFGWKMWDGGVGGGYIAIGAIFLYYHDSIVSYRLTPELPEEKGLVRIYRKWYKDFFSYKGGVIQPFNFHQSLIQQPLPGYSGSLHVADLSTKIINYMTPFSGTMYGYGGGDGTILSNRQAFLAIKDSLTNADILLLMYSKNPATRLTAIEYYLSKKDDFGRRSDIDQWVETNFKEMPRVKTMFGCSETMFDTRELVKMISLRDRIHNK